MFQSHKTLYFIIAIAAALGIGAFVIVKISDFKREAETDALSEASIKWATERADSNREIGNAALRTVKADEPQF